MSGRAGWGEGGSELGWVGRGEGSSELGWVGEKVE